MVSVLAIDWQWVSYYFLLFVCSCVCWFSSNVGRVSLTFAVESFLSNGTAAIFGLLLNFKTRNLAIKILNIFWHLLVSFLILIFHQQKCFKSKYKGGNSNNTGVHFMVKILWYLKGNIHFCERFIWQEKKKRNLQQSQRTKRFLFINLF